MARGTMTPMTGPALVTLLWGEDAFWLRETALAMLGNIRATEVDAADWSGGELQDLATPSLFGEPRALLVTDCRSLSKAATGEAHDIFLSGNILGITRADTLVLLAVTVPVRRGGILSVAVPIPPATISFHGAAVVHPAGGGSSHKIRPADLHAAANEILLIATWGASRS